MGFSQSKEARRRSAFWIATGFVCAMNAALPAAHAQPLPAPETTTQAIPQRNPICGRLEAQLAAFNRGQGPDRATEIKRAEDAVTRQQAEVDRLGGEQRRLNCGGGFFLFGGHPPQCDQLNTQSQRARTALDQMMERLQRLEGAGSDREEERQSIVMALAQSNCGPQYRAAATSRAPGFLGAVFGAPPQESMSEMPPPPEASVDASTYRTVCVRMCDGSFFPISFATTSAKFAADERTCQRTCPATQVALYAYHNGGGEDISKAVSVSGKPYTELPNAFRFRQSYDPACTCKQRGESWAAAVKDDPVEHGDVVVTDQSAKAMAQPAAPPKPKAKAAKRGAHPAAHPPAAAAAAAPRPTANALPPPPPKGEAPRAIGPRFYQTQ
jgi:hypothetical protein